MTYEYLSATEYDGCERVNFALNGRESLVVRPKKPLVGNPVAWRTEFFGAFDTVDKALLERGWHLCYHRVSNMYGCDESLVMMSEFQDFIEQTFGLSKKPVLFGFSRGGLYAVNYAAVHTDRVGGLYLDAPVTDIRSWPCRYQDSNERKGCMQWYHLTEETLPLFDRNPNDKTAALVGLPIIIVAGDSDSVVPYADNGKIFAKRFREQGGNIETIVKPNCDHHPHSLTDPTPVVTFIEKNRIKF